MDPNDELVKRAIVREPDAVHAFVKSMSPVVGARIAKASPQAPRGEVEHLAHEIFLGLFDNGGRALRAWSPAHSSLEAFVALVADHEIYSVLASGKRRPWTDDIDLLTASAPAATEASIDVLLARLRADLSAKGFDLFTRLYADGRSTAEVSAELGMSTEAIEAWRLRLSRALQGTAIDAPSLLPRLGARVRAERAEAVDDAGTTAARALDDAAEERIAAALLERVRDSLTHARAAPPSNRARERARARGPRRGRWILAACVALLLTAVAAAAALFATRRSRDIVVPPAYAMTLVSVSHERDPTSAKVTETDFVLDRDGELELSARPAAPVVDAHARAYLVRTGSGRPTAGDVQPWLVPLQVSDDGAVRITGMTRLLFPTTNEPYDIVVFVAAGDALPADADARAVASTLASGHPAPDEARFRAIRGHVRFVEKQPPSSPSSL